MPDRARQARGRSLIAIWASLALFLALLAVLATRLSHGEDPALRSRAARVSRPARQVLVRRIYERVVVVHLPVNAPAQSSSSSQQVSAMAATAAPTTRAS